MNTGIETVFGEDQYEYQPKHYLIDARSVPVSLLQPPQEEVLLPVQDEGARDDDAVALAHIAGELKHVLL